MAAKREYGDGARPAAAIAAGAVALAAVFGASSGSAGTAERRGPVGFDHVGYALCPAGEQWLGISLAKMRRGRAQLYCDIFVGAVGGKTYHTIDEETSDWWGDPLVSMDNVWSASLAGGLTYGVGSRFGLYAGMGFSAQTEYQHRYDPTHILSESGHYWIEAQSDPRPHLVVGCLGMMSRAVSGQVGFSLEPTGLVVGLGLGHPYFGGAADSKPRRPIVDMQERSRRH